MGSVLTFFLNSIFLTIGTAVFALDLTSIWIPLICGTVGFITGIVAGPATVWLPGLALPAFGVLGPGVLGVFVNCWMLGCFLGELFEESPSGGWAQPNKEIAVLALVLFFVPAFCAALLTFGRDFDPAIPAAVFRHGGLEGFWFYLARSGESWRSALRLIFGYGSSLLLFFLVLRDCENRLRTLLNGLAAGALICLVVFALQLSGMLGERLAPYWLALGVHSGSFSGPAALAISALLVAAMLLPRRALSSKAAGLGLAVAALWSGSALVIPGLMLLVLCGLMGSLKHLPRVAAWAAALLGAVSIIVAGVLLGHPAVNRSLRHALPVPAATATLEAINWQQLRHSLGGKRSTYEQLAMSAWRESPIVGTGLESVDTRYAAALSNTGLEPELAPGARDNFYLKLLGEEGVFGFAFSLVSFLVLLLIFVLPKVRREDATAESLELERVSMWCRTALAVFVFFLAAQNFLRFDEVRYLGAVCLAVAICRPLDVSLRFLRRVHMAALLFFLCFPPFFSFAAARSFRETETEGFYPVETRGDERFAWSVSPARLQLCGKLPETFRLDFRAGNPDLAERPLRVYIYEGDVPLKENVAVIELSDQEWHSADVPLPGMVKTGEKSTNITIRVERLWSPLHFGVSSDARWLGIEIRWPKEAC